MTRSRIAIGATHHDPSFANGLNRYTAGLLDAMFATGNDLLAIAAAPEVRDRYGPEETRLAGWRALAQGNLRGNALRLLWHQSALPRLLRREAAAVYYAPVPEGMFSPPCPQVVTVLDLVPLLFPEDHPRLRYYYRHVLPRILRSADAIITISDCTRRDVARHYDVGDKPVHVIHPGFRADVFRPASPEEVARVRHRHGLDEYLLAVGETRPYKNIRRLIEAFARLRAPGLQLAIAGRLNGRDRELISLPRELGVEGSVRFLGTVSDADLAALYTGARAFVFPSLYEGFGLPPLEAMACGCPVVASRAASVPEVCGEAAVYLDPESTESIAAAMAEVLASASVQATLRLRGYEQVRRFGFARAADQTLRVLQPYLEREPLRQVAFG